MTFSLLSLIASGILYLAAAFLYIAAFFREKMHLEKSAYVCVRLGFAAASIYLGFEAIEHGFAFPILNFAHVLAFFAWALAFLYLIPLAKIKTQSFGLILSPALFLLSLMAAIHSSDPAYHLEVKIYFALHIIFAFFAYASLALSFTAALLYLIQHHELKRRRAGTFYHKLPNLESLDQLTYQSMIFGITLLVCAVAVGVLWSHDNYGQTWMNDPKTFLTFISIGFYGFLISLRFGSSMRKSRLALLSLFIFIFMITSFVGGRQFLKGKHSGAAFSGSELHSTAIPVQAMSLDAVVVPQAQSEGKQ